MSSIIFDFNEETALLAVDTLATTPNGTPSFFTAKAQYVPHLKTIIAGTGCAGFAADWATYINNRMLLTGIENLDYHTPSSLERRWDEIRSIEKIPSDVTTTVYHIGYSTHDQCMKGFAYRSANGFISERLDYGLRFKPECTPPNRETFIEWLPKAMNEQRAIQERKPVEKQVFIGGECILFALDATTCLTSTVFEFSDFCEQMETALQQCP
ncbi:hypothetical protein PXK01_18390 [Phaeobacter sp. PT47_59]|uniref:hypothetical protein n=1 Tax=Phaeobacter sp. PT47_59 TaxID=3029979 RepID=UPI00238099D4|nr:hypothetical protein [Phaeobacter sp. PT47_59]MDE4176131.1 hypothetical protein [Phaeobacter sp. PT47_59]